MTQAPKKYATGKLYELDIGEIFLDGSQPRKFLDEQALTELTHSILLHGVLQPVLVQSGEKGKLLLVSGERRYHASIAAGLTTIPAVLTKGDPAEISIVENLLREDLTAIEEAEAIDRLKNAHHYQLSDLSHALGKAESTLCEILSLIKLPDPVKDDCRNDPKAARRVLAEIAKQHTAEKMTLLYEKYKAKGLTRGEIRSKNKIAPKGAAQAAGTEAPLDLAFVARFTKQLNAIDMEKLDKLRSEAFVADLDTLRLAVNRKLKVLKTLPRVP